MEFDKEKNPHRGSVSQMAHRLSVASVDVKTGLGEDLDTVESRAQQAGSAEEYGEMKDLKAGLHQRHIQMIALAGAIGTGLFLGSGRAVHTGGPLGAFLGYVVIGGLIWTVCMSIAELSSFLPLSGGVIRHAEYFVDPALSFAQGWNSVYSYLISIPAELVATAVLFEYWITISNAVWISIFGVLMIASNLVFVRVYGELEFTFAILKIILILMVNIMGIVLTAGGGPSHKATGFQYWRNPGPFVQYLAISGALGQFLGFWKALTNAAYAYSGVENISLAAAETRNPRTNIPKAAKRVIWRVAIFYILSIFIVTLNVPSNDPGLLSGGGSASSPFVLAAKRAGVPVMPSIINAIVITSAWSSGNSSMLGGSRVLFGLARDGRAPKFFARCNRFGVPYVAVSTMGVFCALGYMTLSDSASTVFDWFQDLVSAASYINWIVICTVYLRFYYALKKQGISRSELPWAGPLQPYAAWVGLTSFSLLLITGGFQVFIHGHWSTEGFVSSYLDIGIFFVLFTAYKLIKRTKLIPLDEVPLQHFLAVAKAHPETPAPPLKGWGRLNLLWS